MDMKDKYSVKWEMFQDKAFHDLWAVRPIGDRDFNSPRLFHFMYEEEAKEFKRLVELSHHSVPNNN
jgi:hypothetical protein